MTTSTWRQRSRTVIQGVLLEYEAQRACLGEAIDEKLLFNEIRGAYPFGQRAHHPYKQWLKEVNVARAFLKTNRPMREFSWFASQSNRVSRVHKPVVKVVPGQMGLEGLL